MTSNLPPLPKPRLLEMRRQAALGCILVLAIIAACLAVMLLATWHWTLHSRAAVAVIASLESAVALGMLAGLMFGDPGVVKRTDSNVRPLPDIMAGALADGNLSWGNKSNIRDGDRIFCVRCLLWRDASAPLDSCARATQRLPFRSLWGPSSGVSRSDDGVHWCATTTHHCSTCQRCVRHFDHHCVVFGRCIAGRGLQGNLKYFIGIISMAAIGVFTTGSVALVAFFANLEAALQ
jgi:hypothetical protein